MQKTKYKQGIYSLLNEEKYIGNKENIIYRSSIELRYMRFLDKHKSIIKWNSEEIIIPYPFEIDKNMHRYFPDFYIEYLNTDGNIEKAVVEIKSSTELIETLILYLKKLDSEKKEHNIKQIENTFGVEINNELLKRYKNFKYPQKITKKYKEYIIYCFRNISKWKAAKRFCQDNNMKFIILTELDLNYI